MFTIITQIIIIARIASEICAFNYQQKMAKALLTFFILLLIYVLLVFFLLYVWLLELKVESKKLN